MATTSVVGSGIICTAIHIVDSVVGAVTSIASTVVNDLTAPLGISGLIASVPGSISAPVGISLPHDSAIGSLPTDNLPLVASSGGTTVAFGDNTSLTSGSSAIKPH